VRFYGVAGPYLDVEGYIRLDADPGAEPVWWLTGGVRVTVGIEFTVLGKVLAGYSETVYDYKRILAQDGATTPPEPEPALAALADASTLPLVMYDTFDKHTIWLTQSDYDDDLASGTTNITGGKYIWDARAKTGFFWWSVAYTDEKPSDFYIAVDLHRVSGARNGECGVIFREVDSDNVYLFLLRETQYYEFVKLYQGEVDTLINWKRKKSVNTKSPNHLVVVGRGNKFYFFINDTYVDEFTDSQYDMGRVGVAIGLPNKGDEGVFEFDNFELRAP
jgi:hypothetical protein